jgi:hypothetical protein
LGPAVPVDRSGLVLGPGARDSVLYVPAADPQNHLHDNAIKTLNSQLRRAVKTRGHFLKDEAAINLLWLILPNY